MQWKLEWDETEVSLMGEVVTKVGSDRISDLHCLFQLGGRVNAAVVGDGVFSGSWEGESEFDGTAF